MYAPARGYCGLARKEQRTGDRSEEIKGKASAFCLPPSAFCPLLIARVFLLIQRPQGLYFLFLRATEADTMSLDKPK
jgi:hypothetical protein